MSEMASNGEQQTISPTSAFPTFPSSLKYVALVVVGEPLSEGHVEPIVKEVEKGVKNWDIDAQEVEYEDVLKALATADVKEIGLVHRYISHAGNQLGIVVAINPTQPSVATELRELLLHPAPHKHLIYGGLTAEGTGDWMLHDDIFTLTDISEIFADPQVEASLQKSEDQEKGTLVLSNCMWSTSVVTKQAFSKSLNFTYNPSDGKHELEGIATFVDFIRSQIVIPTPFQLLEPPTMGVGVKCKITKPTVLVFPAANGDCGFFAVGDFSIFIGGGYCTKSCFWKFAKHLNRVDAILVPHMNPNCLLGVNSFLQRKLSETQLEQPEQESDGFEDWQTKCNSPELGVVYLNSPATKKTPSQSLILKSFAVGSQTVRLSKELGYDPITCCAGTGKVLEPITLFQKVGIGRLDMFVLSPTQNSKELKDFFTQWSSGKAFSKVKTGVKVNDKDAELSLLDAVSICALIVWQPWNQDEDIVRVLFPGNAPQNKILEGLDKLKHLDFLKYRDVSKRSLANGGKALPRKKPGTGSAKATPKSNGPVKKSQSPTKEEKICEDGIHCNTPPPSPTGASADGMHNIVPKCEDGVHCNTPPPDEESSHSFVPINKCEDGVHCNTPPPDDVVCSDGVHCNTPPPEEENNVDWNVLGKCEDGLHCNTPPPEEQTSPGFIPVGKCEDGEHCNTPPPEDGVCSDGVHCNTPPPEEETSEGFIPIVKCEDGVHCNTPPPEDGVCSDGVHCNTPPPEEEGNGVYDTEASADPVQHQDVDDDASAGLQEQFLNVKDSDQPSSEGKNDQVDLDGANSSGHGTAAATPEQIESPLGPSGGFGDEVDQEDPVDEQPPEVTDANHNLELTFGVASPDVVHDSSGIDTEESPSPDQQHSWDPQVEAPTDPSPLLPPDVVTDHEVGGSGDLEEMQSEDAAHAEVTSDAVEEEVAEGEEHEESSEDVSQASEIEVKPSSLSDEPPPVIQETPAEEEQKDDMETAMQEVIEMDTNVEGETVLEEKDGTAFEGHLEGDQNVIDAPPPSEFDSGIHAGAPKEGEIISEETEDVQHDVVMEETHFDVEVDLLQSTEGVPAEEQEDFEKMEVTPEEAEQGFLNESMDDIQSGYQGDLMQTSTDEQENVVQELEQEQEIPEEESAGTNVDDGLLEQQDLPIQVDSPEPEFKKEDDFGAQLDEGNEQMEEEDKQLEGDGPQQEIPPEAVFDDFAEEEKGEIEDDSLEARFETEEDSLEVRVGTTDDQSIDEISEDKDAYQEKETVMIADDSGKQEDEGNVDDLAHEVLEQNKEEEAQEEDSLEVGTKEHSDSQEPLLLEVPGQEEVSVEEVSKEEHSIEDDKSKELEEENLGSDQIQLEVQPPEQQESESTPLSEEFEQNISPEVESGGPLQGSSGEDQNLVDVYIESAPAAVDVNLYPVEKPQEQKEGEEDAPNSEIERFFAPPEPRLLHDDHPITESQNTSDGVMEIEDVSAASEEIPAEVVTSEESPPLDAPVVVPDVPPVAVPPHPVKDSSEGESVEKPKQSLKKTEVKKTTKSGKTDIKKSVEVKVKTTKTAKAEKPSRMSLPARSTTTTTTRKTAEKKSETKTGTTRKSLEKKAAVKKTTPLSEKKSDVNGTKAKSTPTEKKTVGTKLSSRPSTGTRTEVRKSVGPVKTTTKKAETHRPGPSGKPNGPTRTSVETTKRTTVKTTRVTSGKGDSRTNGGRRSASATTKGSVAAKGQSIPSSGPAVYVDLTYIPNHGAAENVNSEFFRRIRAKNYVISGNNKSKKQPNIAVLEALLDGKMRWEDAGEKTTLIPTHDVHCIREWQLTKQQEIDKANIEIAVPATRSIVQMKDENFFMYKVEFDQNGLD